MPGTEALGDQPIAGRVARLGSAALLFEDDATVLGFYLFGELGYREACRIVNGEVDAPVEQQRHAEAVKAAAEWSGYAPHANRPTVASTSSIRPAARLPRRRSVARRRERRVRRAHARSSASSDDPGGESDSDGEGPLGRPRGPPPASACAVAATAAVAHALR